MLPFLAGGFHGIDHLETDPAIATALGNMVVAWSAAEYALIDILSTVTGSTWPMASDIYYTTPTFESRIKVIRNLIKRWETTEFDKEAIDDRIEALSRLSKTRNGWIHGNWVKQYISEHTFIFDMRANPREPKPVKGADISNHVRAVQQCARRLRRLLGPPETRPPASS